MNTQFSTLGEHIETTSERNKSGLISRTLGININKEFIPTVGNLVGTDLTEYKVVNKGTFACNPLHVGRDKTLPVALFNETEPALVSKAYFTFKVKDNSPLLPEYLMLFFKLPTFDRNCWRCTDGSVRGGISWDDLCRIPIHVPSRSKQEKVVNQFHLVKKRIALKQAINDNLAC